MAHVQEISYNVGYINGNYDAVNSHDI